MKKYSIKGSVETGKDSFLSEASMWSFTQDDQDELDRIERAPTTKIIEEVDGIVYFQGRGKKPYLTTLKSCSCHDAALRKKPCKHMFRLAIQNNLISICGVKLEHAIKPNGELFLKNFYDVLNENPLSISDNELREKVRYEFIEYFYKAKSCKVLDRKGDLFSFKGTPKVPVYHATINSCECKTFQKHGGVCKHMFRVAIELGLLSIDEKTGEFISTPWD